ncbi:MAG: histidine triad nucleotide-binding protein [Planctomycetes bacterium]|nr:histidine triad nucleotide-binding protein [Planctomycetota bacterium]
MNDCLFCKIAGKKIPSMIVRETDEWVAFRDINPQAPTHVLVVPRKHVATVNDLDPATAGMLVEAGKSIAREEGLAERGYRLVLNCNAEAGQTVFHVHLHLLGGRTMKWPPG